MDMYDYSVGLTAYCDMTSIDRFPASPSGLISTFSAIGHLTVLHAYNSARDCGGAVVIYAYFGIFVIHPFCLFVASTELKMFVN
jgi:hypothetical protein